MIEGLIQLVRKRAQRERVIGRISNEFWRVIDNRHYDIVVIGNQKAARNIVKFADPEQRRRISTVITPNQIEKLVPGLRTKQSGSKQGIDLIFIAEHHQKDEISMRVRRNLSQYIPLCLLLESYLITYGRFEQLKKTDKEKKLPEKTYIVASSRRTGSTMLCELLKKTGVLGYPDEYISERLSVLTEQGMINPGYVLEGVLKINQTPNGVFGIKVHWSSLQKFNQKTYPELDENQQQLFKDLLDNSAYVFLSRRNKLRQAISDWRAINTGIFHIRRNIKNSVKKQHNKKLHYDYSRLKRHLINFVKNDEDWRSFFKKKKIQPIEIIYEDMIKTPEEAVNRVLNYLSESHAHADFTPDTEKQSDEFTEEIYEKFTRDLEKEYGKDMVKRLEWVEPVKDVSVKKGRQKKHVLVTLATRNYIDMAKQLFSSAYFNGGWDGDYLLLAHDIPEEDLSWFRERGIIIKHTAPLYEEEPGGMHACLADKFHMFTPYFKKWRTVVYSDLDVIVKETLHELKEVKGFWAVEDWSPTLLDQIVNDKDIEERHLDRKECMDSIKGLNIRYDLSTQPFGAGFFAFSTDIITDDLFMELKKTMDKYQMISKHGDQLSFNLCFYHRWRKLNHTFNVLVAQVNRDSYDVPPHTRWGLAENLNAYVLHIFNPKPWDERSAFYWEWLMNLKRADDIGRCKVDKDFDSGIKNIKRTERRIRLREKTYHVIERYLPYEGAIITFLNYMYWSYIRVRGIMYFIASSTDSRLIKKLLRKTP
ncbi:MAG: Stf0 family sulfotransferase [Deltaproteobacteria bacterium]